MMAQLTLDLPDSMIENAGHIGRATNRDAPTVLAQTLEMMWPVWEDILYPDIFSSAATLSDEDVLKMADMEMNPAQNERLGELQSRGKRSALTPTEQVELLMLIHQCQIGQLRKSEGLAEAVRRGLREPLPS